MVFRKNLQAGAASYFVGKGLFSLTKFADYIIIRLYYHSKLRSGKGITGRKFERRMDFFPREGGFPLCPGPEPEIPQKAAFFADLAEFWGKYKFLL